MSSLSTHPETCLEDLQNSHVKWHVSIAMQLGNAASLSPLVTWSVYQPTRNYAFRLKREKKGKGVMDTQKATQHLDRFS